MSPFAMMLAVDAGRARREFLKQEELKHKLQHSSSTSEVIIEWTPTYGPNKGKTIQSRAFISTLETINPILNNPEYNARIIEIIE